MSTPQAKALYVVFFAETIRCFTTYFAYLSLVFFIYCRYKYIVEKTITPQKIHYI